MARCKRTARDVPGGGKEPRKTVRLAQQENTDGLDAETKTREGIAKGQLRRKVVVMGVSPKQDRSISTLQGLDTSRSW